MLPADVRLLMEQAFRVMQWRSWGYAARTSARMRAAVPAKFTGLPM